MKCIICNENIVKGRKHKPTGEIICDNTTCWSEWFIDNTTLWGRM